MKIFDNISIERHVPFSELKIGEVFSTCETSFENVYMKVPYSKKAVKDEPGKPFNAISLVDGNCAIIGEGFKVFPIEAELILKRYLR